MLNCKYFLYVRKSSESEDRQIQSIDDQLKVLKNLAKERQLEIVDEFVESKSAKSPGRPVFNNMVDRLKNGEANGIIAWKLDRLSRNPIDSGTISWLLQKEIIKHIQTSDRSYYPEDNVLLMAVENGMANQFIRDLSNNTKRGLIRKAERGWYPAQPTLGYIHNPEKKKGDKEILKDPNSFDLVRKMFDLMLTGAYTPPQILKIATEDWGLRNRKGEKVARGTIYYIFKNPFYYGTFEYPVGSGNFFNGAHEPMITFQEFKKIQSLLGRDIKQKPEKHLFPFTGIIKCEECGAAITAEHKHKVQKNGNEHHYIYYHCTGRKVIDCSQNKSVEQKELVKQIVNELSSLFVPSELIEWAINQIECRGDDSTNQNEAIMISQKRELSKIEIKLSNLFDLRLEGEIDEELFRAKREELLLAKDKLSASLKALEDEKQNTTIKLEDIFDFSNSILTKFQSADDLGKKEILSLICSNLSLLDKKLTVSFKKPINYIREISEEVIASAEDNDDVRTQLSPYTTRTYGDFSIVSPVLLRE